MIYGKHHDYGIKEYEKTQNTKSEIGNCLFSLLALCLKLGVDAGEALDLVLNKYTERFEHKSDIGSGR